MKKIIIVGAIVETVILIAIMTQLTYPLDKNTKTLIANEVREEMKRSIFDAIWRNTFHWFTFFESLDGFTVAGTTSVNGNNVLITTGATSGNRAEVNKQPSWQGLFTFSRRSNFRSAFALTSVESQTIYITVGNKDVTPNKGYYGFKIVNGNLYGLTSDGTNENAVLLQAVSASTGYNIEARYQPKSKVIFLVNNIEKGSSVTKLPKADETTANLHLMDIEIVTNENVAKTIQMSFFEYLQHRNQK